MRVTLRKPDPPVDKHLDINQRLPNGLPSDTSLSCYKIGTTIPSLDDKDANGISDIDDNNVEQRSAEEQEGEDGKEEPEITESE